VTAGSRGRRWLQHLRRVRHAPQPRPSLTNGLCPSFPLLWLHSSRASCWLIHALLMSMLCIKLFIIIHPNYTSMFVLSSPLSLQSKFQITGYGLLWMGTVFCLAQLIPAGEYNCSTSLSQQKEMKESSERALAGCDYYRLHTLQCLTHVLFFYLKTNPILLFIAKNSPTVYKLSKMWYCI
jgi:hypothetical protein